MLHFVLVHHIKIPIEYIYVCSCNVTKCGKVQGGGILFQATVAAEMQILLEVDLYRCPWQKKRQTFPFSHKNMKKRVH